jgi:uncharacterized protein (TIGR02598 family)
MVDGARRNANLPLPPVNTRFPLPTLLPDAARQPGAQARRGFSLIEVTLALGLMTFVSFGLLGLLPEGLSNFRKSMDYTVRAQITQELASMVQRTSYADLQGLGRTYYYDGEGIELEGAHDPRAVYKATLSPAPDLPALISPVWSQGNVHQRLRAVNIEIGRVHAPPSGDAPYKLMTYVADTGI